MRGLLLFSLLIWAQLVFGLGMTAWRYRLVAQGEADVLISGLSPRIRRLGQLARDLCPAGEEVVYLSTGAQGGEVMVRYFLFPRPVTVISAHEPGYVALTRKEIEARSAGCLLVFGASLPGSWQGERVSLNDDDFVLLDPG